MAISEKEPVNDYEAQAKQIPIHIGFFEHDIGTHADNTRIFSILERQAAEAIRSGDGNVVFLLETPEYTEKHAQIIHHLHSTGFSYKDSFILHSYSFKLLSEHADKPHVTNRIKWTFTNPHHNPIKKLILQHYISGARENFNHIAHQLDTDWDQLLTFIDTLESRFGNRFTIVFEGYSESKLSSLKRHMREMDTCMQIGDIKGAADALFNQMWSIHQETSTRDPNVVNQIIQLVHTSDVAIVLSLFGANHQMVAESLFTKGYAVYPYVTEDGEQYANLLFGIMRQIRRGENPSYFLLKRAAILSWYYRNLFASWTLLPTRVSSSTNQKHAIERTQILSSIVSSREDILELEKQLNIDPEHNTFRFLNKLTSREILLTPGK